MWDDLEALTADQIARNAKFAKKTFRTQLIPGVFGGLMRWGLLRYKPGFGNGG
jgi:hypothetical protein